MSENYDYLKERVTELAFEIKRKDEVLAWDADKILECTTKIVEQSKRIAELEKVAGIDVMVSRFLCWRLPQDFAPDGRVKFERVFLIYDGFDGAQPVDIADAPAHYWPTGTNLFNAEQAKAMIEHMLGIIHE